MKAFEGHPGRFPHLDAMRAVAALAVVAVHLSFANGLGSTGFLAPYLPRLEAALAVLFLISAFLLYRPFAAARLADRGRPRTAAYAWRRFLRIAPAYWVALTVLALLLGATIVREEPLAFYGFAQIYQRETFTGFEGFFQAWTLCVEVTFYAFLPLWALLLRAFPVRNRTWWLLTELAALVVLVLLSVAYKAVVLSSDALMAVPALVWLPAYLDWFAIGMGLAVLSLWWQDRPLPMVLRPLNRMPVLSWLVALVAFWALSTQIGLTGGVEIFTGEESLARHGLSVAVGLFALLPVVFGDQSRGVLRSVLASRVLVFLGVVSYGIYVWHFGILVELQNLGLEAGGSAATALLFAVLLFGLTIAVAALSYVLVERPALALKDVVRWRTSARPDAAPPTPTESTPALTSSAGGPRD